MANLAMRIENRPVREHEILSDQLRERLFGCWLVTEPDPPAEDSAICQSTMLGRSTAVSPASEKSL